MIPPALALFAFAIVPPALFYVLRPHVAAAITLVGGTMFLPNAVGFNLPVLPTIGKEELAAILAMGGALVAAPGDVVRSRPFRGAEILLVVLAIGTVFSRLGNTDPVYYGALRIPGVDASSIPGEVIGDFIRWGFPFFVGRALFHRAEHLRDLLFVMVFAGLVYSLPIFVEIQLSPQMHRWTYGFHQHGFYQTIRESGYRPMVYMRHGLHVALFAFLCATAAWTLTRTRFRLPLIPFVPKLWVAGFLTGVLVLCKSLGAMFYAVGVMPLVALTSTRTQALAALAIAVLAFSYPMLRAAQVIPVEPIISSVEENFGYKRARSLSGRLRNEEQMMVKIKERPLVGWASSGRPMQRDPETGEIQTTYDGVWVILMVKGGVVRYFCIFGLLLLPVVSAWRGFGGIRSVQSRAMVSGLSLMVVINVFDLLPNSTVEGYLTMLSGVLAGVVPGIAREEAQVAAARRDDDARRPADGEAERAVVAPAEAGEADAGDGPTGSLARGLLGGKQGEPPTRSRR